MNITSSESLIMDALWRADGPLSIEDLQAELRHEGWADGTIRAFLARMLRKKAVAATRDGKRRLYRPLVKRETYVHAESRGLLDRLFDGQIDTFVAHFSEQERLSKDDIARLRKLVEKLSRDK